MKLLIHTYGVSPPMALYSHPLQTRSTESASVATSLETGSSLQRLVVSSKPSCRSLSRWGFKTIVACSGRRSSDSSSPSKALRRILESPGIYQGPACFDALSAKLVESAGFEYCFTSGFSISAARLGLPDVGLISYGEMVDQGQQITQAVSIPVIGDGDNGYGNAMNVKRTVKGFIRAGFAGIILEDQVSPKACGHTHGRKVVSREEAVMRIKAAIDARRESRSDIVIIARTDARQAVSLDESLWRSRAFASCGADVLFIDALASKEEMKAFCDISPSVPKMSNMLEGGGRTPILNPIELEEIGFKLVSYPLSLIGVSIQAMQDALTAIKSGRIPPPGTMPSFEGIKETLGFNTYYEEEKRYATTTRTLQPPLQRENSSAYSIQRRSLDDAEQRDQTPQEPVVEVLTPDVYSTYDADGSRGVFPGIWSRTLRVKITGRDGFEKLDVRIPAGFLSKLIGALLRARRVADALEMFDEMLGRGIVPSTGKATSFIRPLCNYGPPHAAMMIYKKARKVGCKISLKAYKLLLMRLSRFGKCGMILKLWNEMQQIGHSSDVEVYEHVINGLCNVGQLDNAVLVMEEALCKGFCPGKLIYSKLNNKLLNVNKVKMAYKLFLKVKTARCSENARIYWRANGWHF